VDIFHYDSDKSMSGRNFAVQRARRSLSPSGLIMVDDILDDSWFREHVEGSGESFMILEGRCGVLGAVDRLGGAADVFNALSPKRR
jgi:hypothetical protein